jgi:hypothetical protein
MILWLIFHLTCLAIFLELIARAPVLEWHE